MMKRTLTVILAVFMLLSVLPMSVSAAERVTRTTGLYLDKDPMFAQDCANESEGWSWDYDTKTLTLDNCRIEAGEQNAVNLTDDSVVTFVLIGENYMSSYGDDDDGNKVICREFGSGLKITGEGSLTVEALGSDDAIDVTSLEVESGTLKVLNGMVWALNRVTVKGGRLEIDVLNAADDGSGVGDDCIYGDGVVEISGGEVVLKAQRAGIFIDGWIDPTPNGLVITGGDVYMEGGTCAAWIGYDGKKKVTIDTTGSLTIDNSTIGIYSGNGHIEVLKGTINNPANLERDMLFRDPDNDVMYAPADYSAVDAALAKVPADLTKYTEESAAAVQAAIDAVDKELDILDQAKVDEYAKAIETALEGLEESGFFAQVKAFFENLFNGETECPVLKWIIKVFNAIVNFFTGLFVK